MDVSENFTNLLISFESEVLHGYIDPVGILTVGIGHVVLKGEVYRKDQPITLAESRRLLRADADKAINTVNSLVKVSLTQNQFDALVSLVFNIGRGNFAKSTLLRKLNEKNYKAAAAAFMSWVYADGKKLKGLIKRRSVERALFEK